MDANDFMEKYHIGVIKSVGHFYSWHGVDNNGEAIMSRIDHFFVNGQWFSYIPNVATHYLNLGSQITLQCW